MNIAIIGCGYLGKAAARHWKKQKYNITATTRHEDRLAELQKVANEVVVLQEDFDSALTTILPQQDAILLSVAADTPEDYEKTYLQSAKSLAAALPSYPSIRQVIYTSSTSVYGDHQGKWVDEATPLAPATPQAEILVKTEHVLMGAAREDLHVCIFRLGEIYGPGRSIADRLRRLEGHALPGTGDNFTNISHIDDIVEGLVFALKHHLNGIYNLCSEEHSPRRELYQKICQEEGLPPVTWDHSRRSVHSGNKQVSSAKLKDLMEMVGQQ